MRLVLYCTRHYTGLHVQQIKAVGPSIMTLKIPSFSPLICLATVA